MRREIVIALTLSRLATAAAPVITRVEPPNWNAEPNATTLRLLLTGANLSHVSGVGGRFLPHVVKVNEGGTHLLMETKIPGSVSAGSYPFEISTPEGKTEAPFSILPPLPSTGRFQGFSPDDIIYLIMPDRFANGNPTNDETSLGAALHNRSKPCHFHGGDLQGIVEHLPYLKDIGITALWLTPIYKNSDRPNDLQSCGHEKPIADYHGYHAVDFYSIDPHFALDVDEFKDFVDKAHSYGIKVIQDQVANHVGPKHPWIKDPPTRSWFNGSEATHLSNTWRTWTLIDPHSPYQVRRSTTEGWFAGLLPDLNQADQDVETYLIQNSLWWIGRTGIDGVREDTLPYVPRDFWKDWTASIKQRYPKFAIVGEVFDDDPALVSFFQGGRAHEGIDTGIDTLFDFPLHGAIRKVFAGSTSFLEIPKVLAHDYLYPDASRLVTFFDLHDVPRLVSERGGTIEGLKNAFTFLLTARGTPLMYYGDEIGIKGNKDPDNRRDFPGGWKEDRRNAFASSGRTREEQSVFRHVQRLAALRATCPPLRRGTMWNLVVDDRIYAFARVVQGDFVLVVFNNSTNAAVLEVSLNGLGVPVPQVVTLVEQLHEGATSVAAATFGTVKVRLPSRSAAVYVPILERHSIKSDLREDLVVFADPNRRIPEAAAPSYCRIN